MNYSMKEPLTLESVGAEKDFQEAVQKVLRLLQKGESGSVTLKLTMKRPVDMDTMLELATEVGMSAPPAKKRRTMGRIGADGIYVETPQGPAQNVIQFREQGGQ